VVATPVPAGRLFALPGPAVFPDGIAYQAATGDFFVGSRIDGAIYRGNVDSGAEAALFIAGQPGAVATGLALDERGRLHAAGGDTGLVAVYDAATGQTIALFTNTLAPNTFLNDVAVAPGGDAFVTDSFNPLLYRLPAAALKTGSATPVAAAALNELDIFVDFRTTPFDLVQPGFNASGIAATPDGRYLLLVQSNTGALYRIDLASGEVIQVDLGGGSLPGAGGIELDGQTLYVVREGQITSVELAADFASGTVGASFTDPSFAAPTTIARYDGCLLVVNSQLDALGGSPVLPFTVSAIPLPDAPAVGTGATPTAGTC
jgi:Cu-Zn family superoxide dismutase